MASICSQLRYPGDASILGPRKPHLGHALDSLLQSAESCGTHFISVEMTDDVQGPRVWGRDPRGGGCVGRQALFRRRRRPAACACPPDEGDGDRSDLPLTQRPTGLGELVPL
jgi:hypothetical protein